MKKDRSYYDGYERAADLPMHPFEYIFLFRLAVGLTIMIALIIYMIFIR